MRKVKVKDRCAVCAGKQARRYRVSNVFAQKYLTTCFCSKCQVVVSHVGERCGLFVRREDHYLALEPEEEW